MFIEPLESRRLLSATPLPIPSAPPTHSPAIRALPHARAAKTLTRNILGSYHGFYSNAGVTFAGNGYMAITAQTTKKFTGTLTFDDGPAVAFNAKLTPFKPTGSQGAGYYFTFPYKTASAKTAATKLQMKGAFQNGANGFHVEFTGKLNGAKVPKPHGEFVFTPDDPTTFLR